ncbi:helix-turn-helix domain-containing protein [Glutamicibacter arilaitensis]|uniref:helix-turn-helix domain-containing protein n=1 Tax=Glutamicibacter arilaitensis TaxID=256701 RepID=UPI003FD00C78
MTSVVKFPQTRRGERVVDVEPGVPAETRPVRLLYSVIEAGELLSVSKQTIYDLIDLGELPKVMIGRTGKTIRVAASDLQAYIDNQRVEVQHSWAL